MSNPFNNGGLGLLDSRLPFFGLGHRHGPARTQRAFRTGGLGPAGPGTLLAQALRLARPLGGCLFRFRRLLKAMDYLTRPALVSRTGPWPCSAASSPSRSLLLPAGASQQASATRLTRRGGMMPSGPRSASPMSWLSGPPRQLRPVGGHRHLWCSPGANPLRAGASGLWGP